MFIDQLSTICCLKIFINLLLQNLATHFYNSFKIDIFLVDASQAGAGNLEIIVSVGGRNVPNYVQSEGNARFRVNFKPTEAQPHTLSVKFNGEPVPGMGRYFSLHCFFSAVQFKLCCLCFLMKLQPKKLKVYFISCLIMQSSAVIK